MRRGTRSKIAHVVALLVALVPSLGLWAIPKPPFSGDSYSRYRDFWGGNPFEVYSHFLDLVLMSGNLALIAAVLVIESSARRLWDDPVRAPVHLHYGAILGLLMAGGLGTLLDANHGEGAMVVVFWLAFLPILLGTQNLLRVAAARIDWKTGKVAAIALATTVVGAGLQLVYEPSDTGGPNWLFVPLWLGGPPGLWFAARALRSKSV